MNTSVSITEFNDFWIINKFLYVYELWENVQNDISKIEIYIGGGSEEGISKHFTQMDKKVINDIDSLKSEAINIRNRLLEIYFDKPSVNDRRLFDQPKNKVIDEVKRLSFDIFRKRDFWGSFYKIDREINHIIGLLLELQEVTKHELEGNSISTVKPRISFEETHYSHRRIIEASEGILSYFLTMLKKEPAISKYINLKAYSYAVKANTVSLGIIFDVPRVNALNLKSWIILCHESAHPLFEEITYDNKLKRITREIEFARLVPENINFGSWLKEFACDALALRLIGPIYIFSLLTEYLPPLSLHPQAHPKKREIESENQIFYHDLENPKHPPISLRLKILLKYIRDNEDLKRKIDVFCEKYSEITNTLQKTYPGLKNPFHIFKADILNLLEYLNEIEYNGIKEIHQLIKKERDDYFIQYYNISPEPSAPKDEVDNTVIQVIQEVNERRARLKEKAVKSRDMDDEDPTGFIQDLNKAELWLIKRFTTFQTLESLSRTISGLICTGQLLDDVQVDHYNLMVVKDKKEESAPWEEIPSLFEEFNFERFKMILEMIISDNLDNKAFKFEENDIPALLHVPWSLELDGGMTIKIIEKLSEIKSLKRGNE